MLNLKRRLLIFLASGLILTFIILGLMLPSPAQADVGVQPVLPGGSNIQPEGQTPIQMAAEVVTMDVRSATEVDNGIIQLHPQSYGIQYQPVWYSAVAEVTAIFTMTNPTSDVVSLTAWFPLASALETVSWNLNPDETVPRIASFHVAVDGNPEDYTVSELPNPKGADKPLLPWANFPVSFPAGMETHIQVHYLLPLAQAIKGNELALYYVFQTGAGWAGPIGQAELILNLPYPASDSTLVRVLPTSLRIPYASAYPQSGIPSGGVFEGNQARWTWTNFEPSPQDDFAVWLVDPGLWQELDAARSAVQASLEDGHAWLTLANSYRTLSVKGYNFPSMFSESYLPLGVEAYQKAADLLPDHPAPHNGLALLTLAQYVGGGDVPAEAMQFIQSQLQIARDLENKYPELSNEAGLSSSLVDYALSIYYFNITATANYVFDSTSQARGTETAAFLLTPSVTSTPEPSLTPTAIPSASPRPSSSPLVVAPTIEPGGVLGGGNSVIILVASAVIILTIMGFLILTRMRGKSS